MYSCFIVFSPDCTLHAAITCMTLVLDWQSLPHDYAIRIHARLHYSDTFIV